MPSTGGEVRRLFEGATKEVIVAGYSFDHGERIFAPLYEALKTRGVKATFVLDLAGQARVASGMDDFVREKIVTFLGKNWPWGDPRPAIYYDPRTITPKIYASMHAKCIVTMRAPSSPRRTSRAARRAEASRSGSCSRTPPSPRNSPNTGAACSARPCSRATYPPAEERGLSAI